MITTIFFWNKGLFVLSELHTMGGAKTPPIYLGNELYPPYKRFIGM